MTKTNASNGLGRIGICETAPIIPARLAANQTAVLLGFQEHDIPVLVAAKLLKPLGKPVQNATKYFAACEVEELRMDSAWLSKATQRVYDHWTEKNKRKTASSQPAKPAPVEVVLAE